VDAFSSPKKVPQITLSKDLLDQREVQMSLMKHTIRTLELLKDGHLGEARLYLIKYLNSTAMPSAAADQNRGLIPFLNCLIDLINHLSTAGSISDQAPIFPHVSLLSFTASSPHDQEQNSRISALLDQLYKRRITDYLALVRLCYTCIKAERWVYLIDDWSGNYFLKVDRMSKKPSFCWFGSRRLMNR
jgi:hypothetical protein